MCNIYYKKIERSIQFYKSKKDKTKIRFLINCDCKYF